MQPPATHHIEDDIALSIGIKLTRRDSVSSVSGESGSRGARGGCILSSWYSYDVRGPGTDRGGVGGAGGEWKQLMGQDI